MNQQKVEVIS